MPRWRRWNWWKIGFFVALFAFEFAREIAVIGAFQSAYPNVSGSVQVVQGGVNATGSWKRIDDGGELRPTAITIECWEDTGRCVEVSVGINGQQVFAPYVNTYEARFSPEAVNYQNDTPLCVSYFVRIDLKLRKVFAVRERKDVKIDGVCDMEKRIEMELAASRGPDRDEFEGHFIPLLNILRMTIRLF